MANDLRNFSFSPEDLWHRHVTIYAPGILYLNGEFETIKTIKLIYRLANLYTESFV